VTVGRPGEEPDVDTATRLLRLLTLLQTRPTWPGEVLAERLGVTTRTVRRDVTRLRELGYPIDATAGVDGGYRLGPGGDLPPLLLDDDEAVAVVLGLSTASLAGVDGVDQASSRVLTKLDQVLPPRVRQRVADLSSTVVDARAGATGQLGVDAPRLFTIARHCARSEELWFRYVARDGADTRRRTEPYRLVRVRARWYLVAFDLDKRDWRTFRVDRMASLVEGGARFERGATPDAAELVAASIGNAPYPVQGVIRLEAPCDEAQAWLPATAGWCSPDPDTPDTRSLLHVGGSDPRSFAAWLGWLPWSFEVLAPDELRVEVAALADRLRRAVGVGASTGADEVSP
jgi:predicted DNA-binding transcriptional regulator YafY